METPKVVLSGPRIELETDLENWELAFLRMAVDGEDAIAVSYDDRGRTNLEMVLDASDVEPDRLERHWTHRADYDYIRRLERGFRMERRQLFETLPCEWATRMGAKVVEFFGDRNELQVRLRPTLEAELHQRLVWRGGLPEGRLCADDA